MNRLVRYQTTYGTTEVGVADSEGAVFEASEGLRDADGSLTVPPAGAKVGDLENLDLLPPIQPSKVFGIGVNYARHVAEMGLQPPEEPFLFLKTPNSLLGSRGAIERPAEVEELHFEGELAVVIGRSAKNVAAKDWRSVVLGYTVANDITVREWQRNDGQWVRAKCADTFLPLGPVIATDLPDPEDARIRSWVNGELRQDGSTSDCIFGLGELISYVTRWLRLEPGDVIITGTPEGVGPLVDADHVTIEIEGIGSLSNRVVQL